MFHTYIIAFSCNVIDFDRASYLMDKDLLQGSVEAMRHEQMTAPRWDAKYDAQWVWDYYCAQHRERYGEPFTPNVSPTWDSAPSASPQRRQRE